MSKARVFAIGAVAVAMMLMLPVPAAQAAPPAPPYTVFILDGGGNSTFLPADFHESFTGTDVTTSDIAGGVRVAGGVWSVTVTPPTGGALAVGTFPTRAVADATHYGLTLADVHTCTDGSGTVTIQQLASTGSHITAFSASYSSTCGTDVDPVSGQLRVNSTVGYVDGDASRSMSGTGNIIYGTTQTLTLILTSTGSLPRQFGPASISGADPASFSIASNTCSGHAIPGGSSCAVVVTLNPVKPNISTATLTLTDNMLPFPITQPLEANGQVSPHGTYHVVTPARILDTRSGLGAPKSPVGPGGVVHLQIDGQQGIPATDVSAVVLNVTEVAATTGGFLTAYPTGSARPTASNLNYVRGETRAAAVTVAVGTGGQVDVYNSGSADLLGDVAGYYVGTDSSLTGGEYFPVNPVRLLDTRTRQFVGTLAPGATVEVGVQLGSTPADAVPTEVNTKALAVNITAVNPTAAGYLTAYSGLGTIPATSTLNFAAGGTTANMAIVPSMMCRYCDADHEWTQFISIHNGSSTAKVDVLVDIFGYFDNGFLGQGTRLNPITPTRIVDTRTGLGAPNSLTAGETDTVAVPGTIADSLTGALAMNVTAVAPTTSTYVTLWPAGASRPTASTINAAAGQTVANATITTLALAHPGSFNVYNNVGSTGFLADVAGYYEYDAVPTGPAPVAVAFGAN